MINIAIIGAGLAGVTIANILKNHANITIFEKARGVCGRMSTRRVEDFSFDHGAQFFKADTKEFSSFIEPMIQKGIIKRWDARFVEFDSYNIISSSVWGPSNPHYVSTPGMNAMVKHLSENLNVVLNKKVSSIIKNEQWELFDDNREYLGKFDWVISTAPAEQSLNLLPQYFTDYNYLSKIKMVGCFSLMLGFDQAIPLDFDAALIHNSDISWISVNSSKPDRPKKFCLLIHSTNQWAESHLEDDQAQVMDHLCKESSKIIGHNLNTASYKAIHRWRYANTLGQSDKKHLIDYNNQLAACGDWCIQGKVEAAFTSASSLAKDLIQNIF